MAFRILSYRCIPLVLLDCCTPTSVSPGLTSHLFTLPPSPFSILTCLSVSISAFSTAHLASPSTHSHALVYALCTYSAILSHYATRPDFLTHPPHRHAFHTPCELSRARTYLRSQVWVCILSGLRCSTLSCATIIYDPCSARTLRDINGTCIPGEGLD